MLRAAQALFAWALLLAPASALACEHELLISLYSAGDVARVNACDGTVLGMLDDGDRLAGTQTLRMGPDGDLYVVSEENHSILRFDGGTLAFRDVWLSDPRLDKPTALDFGSDGAAYIGSYGGDRVLRYANGELEEVFSDPDVDGIDAGMAFGPDGRLWIPSFDGHSVLAVDVETGTVARRIAMAEQSPRMLLWSGDGASVLMGAWAGNTLQRLDLDAPEAEPDVLLERARPSGLAWLPDGRPVTISDVGGAVYAVDPALGVASAEALADDERLAAMTYVLLRGAGMATSATNSGSES